jgi:hypothetical protein
MLELQKRDLLQRTNLPRTAEAGRSGKKWREEVTGLALPSARGPGQGRGRGRVVVSMMSPSLSFYVVPAPAYAAGVKSVSFDVD